MVVRHMTEKRKLTDEEMKDYLSRFGEWKVDEGKLSRSLNFMNFADAFSFMTRIAFEAEKINHHPEWSNVYSKVRILLFTHDLGAISTLDFNLAARIDETAGLFRLR